MIEALGFAAAVLTTVSGLPQLVKILKSKSVGDVSGLTYVTLLLGNICWFVYGIFIGSQPLIMANLITGAIAFSIIFLKLKYQKETS